MKIAPKVLLLLAVILACHAANAKPEKVLLNVKCVAVTDGDTIKVLSGKTEIKIRLFGIDAPEKKQAFGAQSKKFMSQMVFGKKVNLRITGKDRYGRSIAWVFINGRNVNAESIRAGYAWWYRQYSKKYPQLGEYEAQARAAKRGLWTDPHAVAPWDWRKQH